MGSLVVPVLSCSLFFQVLFQLLPCLSNQGFYLVSKHPLDRSWSFVSKGRPIWINQKNKRKRIIESSNWCLFWGARIIETQLRWPETSFFGGDASGHLNCHAHQLSNSPRRSCFASVAPGHCHWAPHENPPCYKLEPKQCLLVDHWDPSFNTKTFTSSTLAPSPM